MRRFLALALLAGLTTGCFVNEELAEGERILDQHFAGDREERADNAHYRASEPTPDWKRAGVGFVERAKGMWRSVWKPSPSELYRDDPIVACLVERNMIYVRSSDCRLRGGAVTTPTR